MPPRRRLPLALLAAAAAALLPVRARAAPEPWRPDRAPDAPWQRDEAATPADAGADEADLEAPPEPASTRAPSLTQAILALPVVEEHRDGEGRLVRLARDPSGATVRYAIGGDGRIAELEVWPAARR